jgi:DNA-binding NarL/FixJ family response regulator
MLVESQEDMTVVAEAGDGAEALDVLRKVRADVVMMDVRMPRLNGVEATREITATLGEAAPKVLVLTTFDIDEYAFAGLKAGASGFLLKDVLPADLISGIRVVAAGDAVIAPSVTRRLLDTFAHRLPGSAAAPGPAPDVLSPLTAREREVFSELAAGLTNAEIAGRLVLSDATVKTHVGHILEKLNLRDRVQAVIFAYEHGINRPA